MSNCLPVLLAALILGTAAVSIAGAGDNKSAAKSPLDRLRQRSAFNRWDELKQSLKSYKFSPHDESAGAVRSKAPVFTNTIPGRTAIQPLAYEENAPADRSQPAIAAAERFVETAQVRPRPETGTPFHTETPIEDILPYFDYEPAEVALQEQDCQTICPCPDGDDCKKPGGTKPCPCPEDDINQPWVVKGYVPRAFAEEAFYWDPANVWSYPLYFEDKTLERYGHAHCSALQPFVSVGRFGGQFLLLPYQMAFKPPLQKRYPLGHYRPGEWAPKLHYQIPLNAKAGLVQAGVVTGAFFIFP